MPHFLTHRRYTESVIFLKMAAIYLPRDMHKFCFKIKQPAEKPPYVCPNPHFWVGWTAVLPFISAIYIYIYNNNNNNNTIIKKKKKKKNNNREKEKNKKTNDSSVADCDLQSVAGITSGQRLVHRSGVRFESFPWFGKKFMELF